MMAGSGAVFVEHWHLSRPLGTIVMTGLAVSTVLGIKGGVARISAVAPVLIGTVLLISIWTVLQGGISPHVLAW